MIATPIAGLVKKYKLLGNLAMIYIAFGIMAVSLICRPGYIFGEPKLYMPIGSMVVGGVGMAIQITLCLPEIMDSLEQ